VSAGPQLYPEQSNSVSSNHHRSKVTCRRASLDTDIFEHNYEFEICDQPRLHSVLLPSEDPWSSCVDRTSSFSVASLTDFTNLTGRQTPVMLPSEAMQRFVENVQLRVKLNSCELSHCGDDEDVNNSVNSSVLGSFWTVSSNKEPPKPLAVLAAERRHRAACENELTDVKQRIAQMLGKGHVRRSGLLIL
jgi:hypothetical protein